MHVTAQAGSQRRCKRRPRAKRRAIAAGALWAARSQNRKSGRRRASAQRLTFNAQVGKPEEFPQIQGPADGEGGRRNGLSAKFTRLWRRRRRPGTRRSRRKAGQLDRRDGARPVLLAPGAVPATGGQVTPRACSKIQPRIELQTHGRSDERAARWRCALGLGYSSVNLGIGAASLGVLCGEDRRSV